MNSVFKRMKSDLKEMYDLLQKDPEQARHIHKDMLIAQQLISDSVKKIKRLTALTEKSHQGDLFNR